MSNREATLFGISNGVICQQVNCCGAYGAGLSGAISKAFPVVLERFRKNYELNRGNQFGTFEVIPVTDSLYIANIYSQMNYGNSSRTGIKYTDTNKLVNAIDDICDIFFCPVYVPHFVDKFGNHSGIGCGLAGEKWGNLYPLLAELKQPNLYMLDTYSCKRESFEKNKK